MPDNWAFVAAAYGLTAVVLGLYWRHLVQKEKELRLRKTADSKSAGSNTAKSTDSARNVAGTARANTERTGHTSSSDRENAERSRQPSSSGHPRPDPTSRGPLQS
jgi:hypothetical protein